MSEWSANHGRGSADNGGAQPLGVGILGGAAIAWRSMAPALHAEPSVRLVAVASRSLERAEQFATRFGCAALTDYDQLLARTDIDAVYLPLPTGLHAHWGRQALLAGKHVLVEKSLTADLTSARDLVRLAADRELVLMENFMFVHHGQHRRVRALIDAGTIGVPRVFESQFAIPPRAPDDIRYQPELGGGALLDVGAYTVRAAQLFLGTGLTVDGAFLSYGGGVDLSGSALLHDERGVLATLTFGLQHSYRCAYTIWGSAGAIHLDRAFTCPATRQPVVRVERQDHREELTLPADDHFANVVAHFARLSRQRSDLTAHHAQLLRQAQLLDEIRNRAAANQVTQDEVTEVPTGHRMRMVGT